MTIRIYADFNSKDERGYLDLGVYGSYKDILRLSDQIYSGMPVVVYFDGIEIDAVLEYDENDNRWYGIVEDWTNYRDCL